MQFFNLFTNRLLQSRFLWQFLLHLLLLCISNLGSPLARILLLQSKLNINSFSNKRDSRGPHDLLHSISFQRLNLLELITADSRKKRLNNFKVISLFRLLSVSGQQATLAISVSLQKFSNVLKNIKKVKVNLRIACEFNKRNC